MTNVLITGASGMIGSRLKEQLLHESYMIKTIGRAVEGKTVNSYTWDPAAGTMNENALKGVDVIVHLAGAGIADSRWTPTRKKEILDSRTQSTRVLYDTLKRVPHQVKTIVSASAVGYYGDAGAKWLTEDLPQSQSFLGEVTGQWEAEVERMEELGIRHVCCRFGIVLAKEGGALPELAKTIPLGVAGYFAKDPLYYSWIHIDDVCGIVLHAIENEKMRGSYNTVAPEPVQIKDLMKAIVRAKDSKAILMPVPPFGLKLALGEMADMLLSSQRCSSQKIQNAGYDFKYPELEGALREIYKKV